MRRLALSLTLLLCWLPAQEIPAPCLEKDAGSLRAALERDPENLGLRIRLAQSLLALGSRTAHPDEAGALLEEAGTQLGEALRRQPAARVPLRVKALEAYYEGRFEETLAFGQRLLDEVQVDPDIMTRMAKSYFRLKRREEAADFIVEWLGAGTVPAFGAMQGMIQTMSTDREFLARYEAGLLAAAKEQPDNLVVQLYLASLHNQLGRVPDAWKVLQEAERRGLVDNRSGARPVLVHDLLRNHMEPWETVASYSGLDVGELRQRLEQLPEHAGLAMRLARILDAESRRGDALPYYETVCRLNTSCWPAHQRTAEILLAEGRLPEAATHYRRVLELQPGFLPAALGLARASALAGDQESAVSALLRYGRMFAPDAGALETLALLGDQEGALDRLLGAIREAIGKEPENPFLWALASEVQFQAGKLEEARAAALSAERLGLTGAEGAPTDCMVRAFGREDPTSGGAGGPGGG